MRDPLADAIAAIGDRPATSFRVVKSSAQAGKVTIAGADVAVSPWIGDQPPAGDPVLLLMAEDGSSAAVSALRQQIAPITWNGTWFRDYIEGNYHRVKLIKTGRQVTIQGLGFMHNAATFPAGGVAGAVPAGFEPDQNVIIRCISHEGPGHVRFNIQTNGQLISEAPVSNATYMQFNHVYLAAS